MPDDVRTEVMSVLPWIAVSVPLMVFEGIFTGTLIGREKFLSVNVRKVIGTTLAQLLPLAAVIAFKPTLDVAIPASMFGRVVSVALLTFIAFRSVPARFIPRLGSREQVHVLLGFGGWSTVGSLARQILSNTDRVMLGWLAGASPVAYYSVPANLAMRLTVLPRALYDALFPKFARADEDERERLTERAIRVNNAFGLAAAVLLSLVMTPFLEVWINPDFARQAGFVGQLLAISFYYSCANSVGAMLLSASGRPKDASTILVTQIVPFIIGLYFGIVWFGLAGAVVVRTLRLMVDSYRLHAKAGAVHHLMKRNLSGLVILLSTLLVAWLPYPPLSIPSLAIRFLGIVAIGLWCLWLAPELLALVPRRLQFWHRAVQSRGS